MSRLDADAMTWAALLSRWVEYAQAALALPDDADGQRWRKSAVPIITLQAVTFAIGDLDKLPADEVPYARDKAELLIDENAAALESIWADEPMPELIIEVMEHAADALDNANWHDLMELRWLGEKPLLVPEIDADQLCNMLPNSCGSLAIAQPGTYIMPGEPVAWWCSIDGAKDVLLKLFPDARCEPAAYPRQVFRRIDDDGRILGDVIARADRDTDDADGLPLLVPLFVDGARVGQFTLDRAQWAESQREQIMRSNVDLIDLTADEE